MSAAPVLSFDEQHLLPALAAVLRPEHAALRVRAVRMPDGRDVHDVRIRRVNADAPDLAAVGQADVRPGLAGVGRLVDPVARRQVAAQARLAHADVDDVRIRLRDGDRADRSGPEEAVRDVAPGHAGVVGLPDAAAGRAHVVDERLAGDAGDRRHAAAAIRADAAPAQRRAEVGSLLAAD